MMIKLLVFILCFNFALSKRQIPIGKWKMDEKLAHANFELFLCTREEMNDKNVTLFISFSSASKNYQAISRVTQLLNRLCVKSVRMWRNLCISEGKGKFVERIIKIYDSRKFFLFHFSVRDFPQFFFSFLVTVALVNEKMIPSLHLATLLYVGKIWKFKKVFLFHMIFVFVAV